jgi:hypothetical protein
MPALRSTSSKVPVYLLSRSPISKRTPSSASSRPTLRACWVTTRPWGWLSSRANQARRLACAMKNNTEQRRRSTLSTMKKSQATMLAA